MSTETCNLTTANATMMLPSSCIFPLMALLTSTLIQMGSPHSISNLAMFSVIHSSGQAVEKTKTKQINNVNVSYLGGTTTLT